MRGRTSPDDGSPLTDVPGIAMDDVASHYRSLPSVDNILSDERIRKLVADYSHPAVLELVRRQIEDGRRAIADGSTAPDADAIVEAIQQRATDRWQLRPRRVINATGVILHTNLGRAPLSAAAMRAVESAAVSYSDLELDRNTGRRGSRQSYAGSLLCQLTGAEAALVVNNNASAVLLGLTAVASGRDVIVSRAEAVEIGGGFRIPDVLRQSGAELVEVGTTNRTYAHDYESAITERTAAILAVHASNFRVTGFTHTPTIDELMEVGERHGVPVLHDLGSGCLLDTAEFGLAHEPMPHESVASGDGLAFFSGDKLLGGPQAGIVVGSGPLVGQLASHPLARAVRIDKLSLAALGATLMHYVREEATVEIPVWRMVTAPQDELMSRAESWRAAAGSGNIVEGESTLGGGSLPGETLAGPVLSIDAEGAPGGAEALARRLRRDEPAVFGRIEDEHLLLDPRTVLSEEDDEVMRALASLES